MYENPDSHLSMVEKASRIPNITKLRQFGSDHTQSYINADIFSLVLYMFANTHVAAFYIYNETLVKITDFFRCLIELKYKIQIEHILCKNNKTLDTFEKFMFVFKNL